MGQYRERIWTMLDQVLEDIAPAEVALDFGSGDGWFARRMLDEEKVRHLQAVDVKERTGWLYPAQIYQGGRLPFADRSFDLTYSIDVLHHCPEPEVQLREVLRCTRQYFLLKDHTYRGPLGKLALCLMDEMGNRRFGIPSLYQYQRKWSWNAVFKESGFVRRTLIYPARCHVSIFGALTNHLQFIALWERPQS